MRQYVVPRVKNERLEVRYNSWLRGLNTLVSPTQIKNDELVLATDVQLIEDGKIQVPRDGQDYFGSSVGSRVLGLFPFYKKDGSTRQLLRATGTSLYKYNSSTDGWDAVSGFTYTTGLRTNGVVAYDNLYLCNGTDNLTKYDGTSITSFTAISAPNTPTVTRTAGSSGTYTFSYKITAVTAVGETTPSAAGTQTLSVGTLDSSNYFTITWSAVTDAIGYNVYGRTDNNWRFIAYVDGNGSTSYIDRGTVTPSTVFTPPEGNSTGGQKGTLIELYKDSLFIAGDSTNPSRLYYSGGGDKINDFTIASGGGFVDIQKDDGSVITAIKVFKNTLIVFKETSIYQFSFDTSGLPSVVQVTSSVGCIAPRSVVAVENDLYFASVRGIFTLGNSEGFAFDVLRSKEVSSLVRDIYQSIEGSCIQNIAAVYATVNSVNYVIFSYTPAGSTTNSEALVYDWERRGWLKWTNVQANCFVNHRDSNGVSHVLYGDDSSGYVKELFTGSNDFGSSISGSVRLRGEDFGGNKALLDRYKVLKDINIGLRNPTGAITLNIIVDGSTTDITANIGTISPSINFGHYVFSEFLFGESYGTGSATSSDDIVIRRLRNLNLQGKSFQVELQNNSSGSFTLLQVTMTAKPKGSRFAQDGEIVEV